jgi:hypothetical protein
MAGQDLSRFNSRIASPLLEGIADSAARHPPLEQLEERAGRSSEVDGYGLWAVDVATSPAPWATTSLPAWQRRVP